MIEFSLHALAQTARGKRRDAYFSLSKIKTAPGSKPGVALWSGLHDQTWRFRDRSADAAYFRAMDFIRTKLRNSRLELVDAHGAGLTFGIPVDAAGCIDWLRCQRRGACWIFGNGLMTDEPIQPFPPWAFDGVARDAYGYEQAMWVMVGHPVLSADGGYRCSFYSSLGQAYSTLYGRTADEAYALAFGFLRQMLTMRKLTLLDERGQDKTAGAAFVWTPAALPPVPKS